MNKHKFGIELTTMKAVNNTCIDDELFITHGLRLLAIDAEENLQNDILFNELRVIKICRRLLKAA